MNSASEVAFTSIKSDKQFEIFKETDELHSKLKRVELTIDNEERNHFFH